MSITLAQWDDTPRAGPGGRGQGGAGGDEREARIQQALDEVGLGAGASATGTAGARLSARTCCQHGAIRG